MPQDTSIPPGLCQCGCGQRTGITRTNDLVNGYLKGQPKRFIKGHGTRVHIALTCQWCGNLFHQSPSKITRRKSIFCSIECKTLGMRKQRADTFAERFWDRVDRSGGPNACWPWMGPRSPRGYGQVSAPGTPKRANRVAYELAKGPLPPGHYACHTCDNPPCCNPAHLFAGTPQDNMQDMSAKGRHRWRARKDGEE